MRCLIHVALVALVACTGERSAPVPGWLQPVFRDLDTLLTDAQRDSLRATDIDSAFVYRNHQLAEGLEQMGPAWQRTLAGDTLIARGEKLPKVQVNVFLDLYQQWLQGRAPDVDSALHRMSPNYVANYRAIFGVDSTLLDDDIDGDGRADRFVRETRTSGLVPVEQGGVTGRRLALYVDTTSKPAWASDWTDTDGSYLRERQSLSEGGSLLLVEDMSGASNVFRLLRVQRQSVQQVVSNGEGGRYHDSRFTLRTAGDSLIATASGTVTVEGRKEPSSIRCRRNFWPGWRIALSRADGRVLANWQVCTEAELGPEAPEPDPAENLQTASGG